MIGAFGMIYSWPLAFAGLGLLVLSIFAWAFEGAGGYHIVLTGGDEA